MKPTVILLLFFIFVPCLILNAQETFIKRQVDLNFQGACSVFAADINNDGHEDILSTASGSNQVAWWENDGSIPPQLTRHIIDDVFLTAIYVYADDINGDSTIDVLGAAWNGNMIALWLNDGGNRVTWTKQVVDSTFTQAHEVKTANIDGTGGIDIIAASAGNNEIAWWQNNGGTPIVWTKYTVSNAVFGARSVFPVDIDNDSDCDLICAAFTSNDIILFRNEGGNPVQWTQEIIDNNFSGAHWVNACDIDNDNDKDILGAAYMAGDIAIWYNEGGNPIQWSKYILESNLQGALSVIADDLDNDSLPDVIATGEMAGDIITWYNQGSNTPSFTKVPLESNFPGAWPVYTFDPDNDMDQDILSASSTLNDIYWWENQHNITTIGEYPMSGITKQRLTIQPNPFSFETIIQLSLPEESVITVRIISTDGKCIRLLLSGKARKGENIIVWDGKNNSGTDADQGFYFCIVETVEGIIANGGIMKAK